MKIKNTKYAELGSQKNGTETTVLIDQLQITLMHNSKRLRNLLREDDDREEMCRATIVDTYEGCRVIQCSWQLHQLEEYVSRELLKVFGKKVKSYLVSEDGDQGRVQKFWDQSVNEINGKN